MMETYLMDASIEELEAELLKRKVELKKKLDSMPKRLKKIDWKLLIAQAEEYHKIIATQGNVNNAFRTESALDAVAEVAFECIYGPACFEWQRKMAISNG